MSPTICDTETLARPEAELRKLIPEWDLNEAMSRVPKNYKNPAAIAGWLEDDKANHGKDLIEKAALNAETAHVVIVGLWRNGNVEQLFWRDNSPAGAVYISGEDKYKQVSFSTEAELIEHAFARLGGMNVEKLSDGEDWAINPPTVLGWNLLGFDLPFLVKRAWLLGVKVPKFIFSPFARYPFPDRFVDTMKVWQVGNYKAPYASLNNTLKAFELPEKGDGKDFGKLWAEDRVKALEYNAQEIMGQAELYKRLGIL